MAIEPGAATAKNLVANYSSSELMTILASRELKDGEVVFVGIGLPNIACNLARKTHAPNLVLIYESGAVGAVPERVPPSIGDPALVTGSLMVCPMTDIFQYFLQNGKIQVGFLGGAQIDRFANINTTVVGPYDNPKVRLPGSGGASEIATHAQRVLIVTKLDKRAFPKDVDFITSPGTRPKGKTRLELGLSGRGPVKVITNMGILEPDEKTGEFDLVSVYPNISPEQVQENIGWKLALKHPLKPILPPTEAELKALREINTP